jgi:hypothetical protein
MRRSRNLTRRHGARASAQLVDVEALCRSLTGLDPHWRTRGRYRAPLHRDAVRALRVDGELRAHSARRVA